MSARLPIYLSIASNYTRSVFDLLHYNTCYNLRSLRMSLASLYISMHVVSSAVCSPLPSLSCGIPAFFTMFPNMLLASSTFLTSLLFLSNLLPRLVGFPDNGFSYILPCSHLRAARSCIVLQNRGAYISNNVSNFVVLPSLPLYLS